MFVVSFIIIKKTKKMGSSFSLTKQYIQSHKTLSFLSLTLLSTLLTSYLINHHNNAQIPKVSLLDIIGNTPLVYLSKLSKAANCHIYVKLEYLNPFGSSKDRAVKQFLKKKQNGNKDTREVVEASSGSTAASLLQMGHLLDRKVTLFLPNDLAADKFNLLSVLGANMIQTPPVSIVDSSHFVRQAIDYSIKNQAYFTDQFQNLQNGKIHFQTTGVQIWEQTRGKIDAFVCGSGTGGTLSGVSRYLKKQSRNVQIVLADPEGSGLANKVNYGVMFTGQQKQGHRKKNPFDTIIQGVGLNRPTNNFSSALIDSALKISDEQTLHMCYYLIHNQGLFVGGSTAMNLVAAVKYGRMKKGSNIVTIAHDSGMRYLKKVYDQGYLKSQGIKFQKKECYEADDLDFVK